MPPKWVAITPDGKHAYVANNSSSNVSVIDTVSNTVVATVAVGNGPFGVGIMPPPAGVPFLAFGAQLQIHFGRRPNTDAFTLQSSFTLSSTAPAINPVTDPVTLQVGTFTTTIPPGSFKKEWVFHLRGSRRRRDPAGGDRADGHAAIRVPCGGTASQLDRNHEPGDGDAGHRRRHGHDLGPGPHPLKTHASRRDPVQLNRIPRECPPANIAAVESARPINDIDRRIGVDRRLATLALSRWRGSRA